MRTCKKCGVPKPLEKFPVADHARGSRRHECHECYKLRHKSYYSADRKRYRQRSTEAYYAKRQAWLLTSEGIEWRREHQKVYNARLRQNALDAYGRECACCGEDIERFLTIDHVKDDGKNMRLEHGTGIQFHRWLKRQKYPDGFQILCFNCNIGRSLNGGKCPHKEGSTTILKGSTP